MIPDRRPDGQAVRRSVLLAVSLVLAAAPLAAQIDPTGRWRTLETAHFRVHVRAEHLVLGERAAAEAEAAWSALAQVLPAPSRRVELILADNADLPNGYTTVYPTPHVVVYALPAAGDIELGTYDRWLRLVITHELVHAFHLDLARGWWGVGRRVLGRAPFLFPNAYQPRWMREGIAVFYESRLTGGGRLGSDFHGAVLEAAAQEAHGLTIDAADGLSPRWPAGLRPYAFGGAFFGHAAERAGGDSVVGRFARETARRPLPYVQLSPAFRRVSGQRLGPAWSEWRQEMTGGQALRRSGGQQAPPRVLLAGLRIAVAPRISPDGRQLLFVFADGTDAERLVTLELASGKLHRLARINATSGAAWTPEGGAVVAELDYLSQYTLRSDLWAVDREGHRRRITRGQRLMAPDVAPDGAIVAVRGVPGGNELVEVETGRGADGQTARDTLVIRVLVPAEPGVEWATPRVSPDARAIAAVRVSGGRHDIVLLSRDGALLREVTHDAERDLQPAFSADGRLLVWSREVDGRMQIVGLLLDRDTTGVILTHEPFGAYGAAPAGDALYYLAYRADGWRLVAGGATAEPWSLPRPDTTAPPPPPVEVPVTEHAYHPVPSVLPQYWVPTLISEPGGAWLGAFTSGADPLGRHLYAAALAIGTGTARGEWRGGVAYRFAGPGRMLTDVAYTRDAVTYLAASPPAPPVCCDVEESGDLGLTAVRRSWRTLALLRLGVEYERFLPSGVERAGPNLSAVVRHTIEPALAISPQDGARLVLTLRRRWRRDQPLSSTEAVARGSLYRSVASWAFARGVLAVRAAAGTIVGDDPLVFSVGGVSGGAVEVPGVAVGGGTRTFPVRGYAPGTLEGERAASLSVEQRVPLALVGRGLGLAPVLLDRVSASLFADGAAAWSSDYCPVVVTSAGSAGNRVERCGRAIGSLGFELVADLGLGYDLPVRLRAGAALRLTGGHGIGAFVASGAAF